MTGGSPTSRSSGSSIIHGAPQSCGSAPCKKAHQKVLARRWYQKRQAEAKAAAVKAPTAVREATPAPVVDKSARRELIRRLAEKKGLAGDADTAVGPVNDPTYVR